MQTTDRFHPFLLPAAFVIWGLTAWFSSGFHHHDEHFQVLEFAQMKMGRAQATDLPWEFRAQMRPGLQPWLTVAIVEASAWLGLNNPFYQTFLMRLLAVRGTLLALVGWGRATIVREGMRTGLAFTGLALFLWCMPYLGVRYSSEGLATAAFLWSALLLYRHHQPGIGHWFLAGLLAGLSFAFRYQMGIALAGMVVWCFFFRPRQWVGYAMGLAGCLLALGIAALADRWLYGDWVFPAYNYLNINVLQDKTNDPFGTMPFWWYIPEYIVRMAPPISLVLLIAAGAGFRRQRSHILLWSLLPFILVHHGIGHKEMRFLFPATAGLLVLAASGWAHFQPKAVLQPWSKPLLRFLLVINGVLLAAVMFRPAADALPYYAFLYKEASQRPVRLYVAEKNPYHHVDLPTTFYSHAQLDIVVVPSIDTLLSATGTVQRGDLVLVPRMGYAPPRPEVVLKARYCYFPSWIKWLNIGNWQSRTRIWTIFEVE